MEVGGMNNKEEPEMEVPWIPTTPVKPILQKQVPIYSPGEGNQVNGAVACHEFTTVAYKNSMPHDGSLVPEATVANIVSDSGKTCAESAYDSVTQDYGHLTFQQLLCQAEKGSLNCSNGQRNPLFSSLMSQFNGDLVTNMANAALSHHNLSFESEIVQDSSRDTQGTAHIACWSDRTPQDSPFTLNSAVGSESRQVPSMQTNIEEKNPSREEKNVSAEKLDNNGPTLDKELCDPAVELGAVSTPSKQNPPDTGNSLVIDLNETPQQKPRRRKHRPKVITEGKPRRTRKPAAQKNVESKEKPTGKRKYVRKKGVNSNSTTPAEETAELIKDVMPKPAKRSCRRSINFETGEGDENSTGKENTTAHLDKDGVVVQETNVNVTYAQTTCMQHASNNMSLPEDTQAPNTSPSRKNPSGAKPSTNTTVKRKYSRRNKSNNSSAPPTEVTGSSLNCDTGAREDNPVGSNNATVHLSKEIDVLVTQETNEGLLCDLNASMEQTSNNSVPLPEQAQDQSKGSLPEAQPKEKPIGKYARRKRVNKSSTPPTEIKEGLNEQLMAGSIKITRRSSLVTRARNKSSTGGENQNICISKENIVLAEETHANLANDHSSFYISLPVEAQVSTTSPSKGSSPGTKQRGKTTRKRTSTRRKGLKTSAPTAEMTGELTEASMPESIDVSLTRPLNFDIGAGKESSMCCRENLNVHLSKENGVLVKETLMELSCDQNTSMNQALYSYMPLPADTKAPSISRSKIIFPEGKLNVNANSVENKNGQAAAQDGHENSANILSKAVAPSNPNGSVSQMVGSKRKHSGLPKHLETCSMNISGAQYNGLATYQTNYSVQFSNIQEINEKRRMSSFLDASSMTTTRGIQPTCPQVDARWNLYSNDLGNTENEADYIEFVSTLRGLDRRYSSPSLIYDSASLTRITNHDTEPNNSVKQGISDMQTSEAADRQLTCIDAPIAEMPALLPKKKRTRKKKALSISADSSTNEMQQNHNFGVGNYHLPLDKSLGIQGISDMQTSEAADRQLTCIDAPVAETPAPLPKKKRTRKKKALSISADSSTNEMQQNHNFGVGNYHLPLDKSLGFAREVIWEPVNSVDTLAEQFRHLALQEQNALVLYKQQNSMADGTIIPFQGPFDPIKKHRRPKVDLDEETDRVWRLLMIDINSHGIDGTDEDKAKWWEEERNVFRGRADSFIARMHLVQGDRRFSRWKGSVLDSVVGVFLTQNVSDHLSSSAFMSLAARYPKKSSSTCKTYNGEGTSLVVKEPQVHIVEPEENTEWGVKTLNQTIYDQSSMTVDMVEHTGEKEAVNSKEPSRTASTVTSLTDESNWRVPESSQRKTEEREGKICYEGMRTELNDLGSSQSSAISGDLSSDQIPEKIGSCSDSNSEVEDLSSTAKDSNIYNSISHECALKQNTISGKLEANCFDPFKTEASSSGFMKNKDENDKNRPCFQRTESASQVVISHSQSMAAQGAQDLMEKVKDLCNHKDAEGNEINEVNSTPKKLKSRGQDKEKMEDFDWDSLRIEAQARAGKRENTENTLDSLDWDAVRRADVSEISDVIKERGMNNRLAERIKNFLNRLVEDHGDINLEWLRDVPPDQAKEYLLSVRGLGLKSVECVRLLTLHHLAFPVDTNVGRIAVRLGWVPLQPLPESLQLHLLELYPVLESIQKYLWPRLCKLDQKTLYELHYQMITFGKVFCTKSKPNCNACPMRGECRHFASAFASARLALPGPEQRSIVSTSGNNVTDQNPPLIISQLHLPPPENTNQGAEIQQTEVSKHMELISEINNCHPIIEEPTTPEPECSQVPEIDMEDAFIEDSYEIPTIKLDMDEFTQTLQNYMQENMELQEGEMSKALVALNPEAASIPMPKLKNVSRLRTEHCVYELPDTHPLLEGCDRREPDDPGKYLLAIWTPGETANSIQPPETKCTSQQCGQLCDEKECLACNSYREASSQIVRGTLLIPCRTAMRGSFPLNGTYFQVNEVFADHDSSLNPISVPRSWIWNLNRRTVYFGTSIPTIFKGLSTQEIQQCFWRGYVCVRGFDKTTRAPRPLMARLHFPASKLPKAKGTNTRRRPTAAKTQGPEPNPEQQPELLTAAKSQGPEPNPEQQPDLLIAAKPQEPEPNPEHTELLSNSQNLQ